MNKEKVLVVPEDALQRAIHMALNSHIFNKIAKVIDTQSFLLDRNKAEADPTFRQIIPYVVIYSEDKKKIFLYQRKPKSGEQRLVSKYSIGIGGHINPEDSDTQFPNFETVRKAAIREILEEVVISNFDSCNLHETEVVIHSSDSEVDKVHIGLLFNYFLSKSSIITVRETDKIEGSMVDKNAINNFDLESWSEKIKDKI